MKDLPSKPSALIRLAIEDLIAVEQSPKYRVDMESWHRAGIMDDICNVCLAGAVIANSLKYSPYLSASPGVFSRRIHLKLRAIGAFCLGRTIAGEYYLSKNVKSKDSSHMEMQVNIVSYAEDSELFILQMLTLADEYERVGE